MVLFILIVLLTSAYVCAFGVYAYDDILLVIYGGLTKPSAIANLRFPEHILTSELEKARHIYTHITGHTPPPVTQAMINMYRQTPIDAIETMIRGFPVQPISLSSVIGDKSRVTMAMVYDHIYRNTNQVLDPNLRYSSRKIQYRHRIGTIGKRLRIMRINSMVSHINEQVTRALTRLVPSESLSKLLGMDYNYLNFNVPGMSLQQHSKARMARQYASAEEHGENILSLARKGRLCR